MAFKWSCFLSYRHNPQAEAVKWITKLYEDLRTETFYFMGLDVYLDDQHLTGGDFIGPVLADNLCRSVCMILVYTPTYFSADYNFCAREYQAMCQLEERRLDAMGLKTQRMQGFIIPVVFRGRDYVPKFVTDNRKLWNFEKFLDSGFRRDAFNYKRQVKEIAEYTKQRHDALTGLQGDPCVKCLDFQLPTLSDVGPLLASATNNSQDFSHVRG